MASLVLPTVNVVSASFPDGDLEVFSGSWRLTVTAVGTVATFTLPTGGRLAVTLGAAGNGERTISGNRHSIWISGMTAQQFLPPLDAVAVPIGGIPL